MLHAHALACIYILRLRSEGWFNIYSSVFEHVLVNFEDYQHEVEVVSSNKQTGFRSRSIYAKDLYPYLLPIVRWQCHFETRLAYRF